MPLHHLSPFNLLFLHEKCIFNLQNQLRYFPDIMHGDQCRTYTDYKHYRSDYYYFSAGLV